MNALFEAALEAQQFIQDRDWQFCVIGGLAVVRWGRPRTTADVDISLLAGFGSEASYVDALLGCFTERVSNAREFALESRVVLALASNGVPLDIALAGVPYEEEVISRASIFQFATDVSLMTASAEDMVILKSFAGRAQDWIDVDGIIERQRGTLDWQLIMRTLPPLCQTKDSPHHVDRLEELRIKSEPE